MGQCVGYHHDNIQSRVYPEGPVTQTKDYVNYSIGCLSEKVTIYVNDHRQSIGDSRELAFQHFLPVHYVDGSICEWSLVLVLLWEDLRKSGDPHIKRL